MKYIVRILLISFLVYTGCEQIESTLDNRYDVDSQIYSGNRPEITSVKPVIDSTRLDKLYNRFVKITWKDSSSKASGYIVQRSYDSTNYTTIGITDKDTYSFVDTTADFSLYCYYVVRTKTETNISLPSEPKKIVVTCMIGPEHEISFLSQWQELAFSPNPNIIAVYRNNSIEIFNIRTQNLISNIPSVYTNQITISHSGQYLAFCDTSKMLCIHKISDGSLFKKIALPTESNTVFFSQDDSRIYSLDNNTFRVWDLQNEELISEYGSLRNATISPSNSLFASNNLGNIIIRDINDGSILYQCNLGSDFVHSDLSFNNDGSKLFVYGQGKFSILDYKTGSNFIISSWVSFCSFTSDGKYILYFNSSYGDWWRLYVSYYSFEKNQIKNIVITNRIYLPPGIFKFYPEGIGRYFMSGEDFYYEFHFSFEEAY